MYSANRYAATALLLLAILGSLLSQLPTVLAAESGGPLKMLWVLPFAYMLLTAPQAYISGRLAPFYLFVAVFALYLVCCQMFTGREYLGDDIYNIAISLLVTLVGYNYWLHHGGREPMQLICMIMLLCSLLISVQVYTGFLADSDITSKTYAYNAKNSVGSILLCCSFVILLFFCPTNRLIRLGGRALSFVALAVMVMVRSRATLLSGVVVLGYMAFRTDNKRLRWWVIIVSILVVLLVLVSHDVYEVVVGGILLGGREGGNLDNVSSGRVILFAIALQLIPQHPLVGSGNYYVDCMPLNILTEYGVVGLLMVMTFCLTLLRQMRRGVGTGRVSMAAYVLYLSFLVNGMLEAYPPFGPGVKCFTLWLLYGFALAEVEKKESMQQEKKK